VLLRCAVLVLVLVLVLVPVPVPSKQHVLVIGLCD
jgi:hypothetical protein